MTVSPLPGLAAMAEPEDVRQAMASLGEKKGEWAALPLTEKVALLKMIRQRLLDYPHAFAREVRSVTGCDDSSYECATSLLKTALIPGMVLNSLISILETYDKTGAWHRGAMREASTGEAVADVTTLSPAAVRMVAPKVETYLLPGASPQQGRFYSPEGGHTGKVAVVLGAGNQVFLGLLDILHCMFVEGCVCWYKYHPVLETVMPFQEYILQPLAERGYYAGARAGVASTEAALFHAQAGAFHMTGGIATHDAIVWGADRDEQLRRKAVGDPRLKIPATSELGNVSPWLVVPGPWKDAELRHYAKHLAAAFADNSSCNCLSPKVVVLAKDWEHTDTFIAYFKDEMADFPLPAPYYPGIHARYNKFHSQYPGAAQLCRAADANRASKFGKLLPWLINDIEVSLGDKTHDKYAEEPCFAEEPFAPAITLVKASFEVPASEGHHELSAAFLERVPHFCNQNLFGTLTCTVLVHPATETKQKTQVESALDRLQYGAVVVNDSGATAFIVPGSHWGGFQKEEMDLANVGSGIGSVHNCGMYNSVQKSVVRTPFASAGQVQPPHQKPIPAFIIKILSGFTIGGFWGALKMLLWAH